MAIASMSRVWKKAPDGSETFCFYGANGQKLVTYTVQASPFALVGARVNVYFGGKLIRADGVAVVHDRLGSVVARVTCAACTTPGVVKKDYFPYGDEIGGATAENVDRFGTYHRDGSTGLDYADQRYYSGLAGRFLTRDRSAGAFDPKTPASWNRYTYVEMDPTNRADPSGLGDRDPLSGYCSIHWDDPECTCPSGYSRKGGESSPCEVDGPYQPTPVFAVPEEGPYCFAQLKYRDVKWPSVGFDMLPANHSFWWVQDSSGNQFIISAGPLLPPAPYVLHMWVSPGSNNGSGDDAKKASTWFNSGLFQWVCSAVEKMLDAARNKFKQDTLPYSPARGPNRNSSANWLGRQTVFWLFAPPGEYGWDYPLP